MTLRVCTYARFSSDLQNEVSNENQLSVCQLKAKSEGWKIVKSYSDAAISGSSLIQRSGMQNLLIDAQAGKFDIVLSEALDRLSRDQEDIAGLFKRMEFAGVKIITLSEGEITPLHIGLKGTMNAIFLKDLAAKTHRGLRGRVEKGKSGGGLGYGYRVVKKINSEGEAIRGDLEIVEKEAKIIRRIFEDYAYKNKSPKAIAAQLNKEGILTSSGKAFGQSTINGNRRRGTGYLNNSLYRGERIWNRQHFIKDPNTGRSVSRINDESEWVHAEVPELRIVPQELWDAVKARQKKLDKTKQGLHRNNRPQYLLSGLLKCGICGGGYSKVNSERYGCSSARNKGESICANKKTIKREHIESLVLNALKTHLMRDDLVEVFCKEYTRHMNALQNQKDQSQKNQQSEHTKLSKERDNLVSAIKQGVAVELIKDDLERVSERLKELETLLQNKQASRPLLHPVMADRYRKEIENLHKTLNQESNKGEASLILRSLIEKIVLTPQPDRPELSIDLHGDLAGILQIASKENAMNTTGIKKRLRQIAVNDNHLSKPSVELVAGAGFEPTTFGL